MASPSSKGEGKREFANASEWLCVVVCLGLLVAGCAIAQNTPAQDRTWNAYRVCSTETGANAVMQRVDPDGRYYVRCADRCTRWTDSRTA